jgi:hypothetical protein
VYAHVVAGAPALAVATMDARLQQRTSLTDSGPHDNRRAIMRSKTL